VRLPIGRLALLTLRESAISMHDCRCDDVAHAVEAVLADRAPSRRVVLPADPAALRALRLRNRVCHLGLRRRKGVRKREHDKYGEDDDESGEHASEGWETEGMSSGYMCTADKGRAIFPSREKACRSTDSDRLKETESWTSGRKAKRASWGHQSRFESVRFGWCSGGCVPFVFL
jgi:hypothetical protein